MRHAGSGLSGTACPSGGHGRIRVGDCGLRGGRAAWAPDAGAPQKGSRRSLPRSVIRVGSWRHREGALFDGSRRRVARLVAMGCAHKTPNHTQLYIDSQ